MIGRSNLLGKYTVIEILSAIKGLLEGEFKQVTVEGEVTNFSLSTSSHYYFSLSDSEALLGCVLFRRDAFSNPMIKNLRDGDKVFCTGSIGVYSKGGRFQLIVKKIVPAGVGDLKKQFELLKEKLGREGLFDLDKKVAIPKMPRRVGVITAPNGAALADFINIFKRRSVWMDLVLSPSLVQGVDAPTSLIHALAKLNTYSKQADSDKKIDLIVITRGGGSLEDLWAFNDERLAKEMAKVKIPIISAVGHQVDYTIADYVADFRAETPSAAAEIITEVQTRMKDNLNSKIKLLINYIQRIALEYKQKLEKLNTLGPELLMSRVNEYKLRIDDVTSTLQSEMNYKINHYHQKIESYGDLLRVLDPNNVLNRGYTYIKDEDGAIIPNVKSFNKLGEGSDLELCFYDGKAKVKKSS
ncbi:MAG: exodeoxyribonuclease VII large subunit [Bacteriovoracaceae bacterium]|nr:exodeoxyribonuclease VII large subunit [Bacteriovoracaceae bacterium]